VSQTEAERIEAATRRHAAETAKLAKALNIPRRTR
jgi:hypothetical protein